jgi:hypothetical protein
MFSFFFSLEELNEALRSNKTFIDLLRRDAQSTKGRRRDRTRALEEPSHPDVDALYNYVLGSLPNSQMKEIANHLSECRDCADTLLEIRHLDKEITKDLKGLMKTLSPKKQRRLRFP